MNTTLVDPTIIDRHRRFEPGGPVFTVLECEPAAANGEQLPKVSPTGSVAEAGCGGSLFLTDLTGSQVA